MKATIIAIGTGASNITESAIFEHFGFDLCYYLINECTLQMRRKFILIALSKKLRNIFKELFFFQL